MKMALHQHDPKGLSSVQGLQRPPIQSCEMVIERTFRSALLAMRLHRNMCVQMVESAISLLTSVPTTLVHALNFFVSPTRPLMLLCTWNRDKGVDSGKWVSAL